MQEDCFHLGVKALIRNTSGNLLLLEATKNEKTYWDIPGGRLKKEESLESALKREVYEETGLHHIDQINPFLMTLSNIRIPIRSGDVGLIFATYLCTFTDDIQIQLSEEHTNFRWFEPLDAAKLLSPAYPIEFAEKLANLKEISHKS